ncbi:outer envelope pore protein 24, chloroplastic-like [Prosopis cineraria]|uniref:outer envelope pore protein 24, chloroplastic-like n=1 Tax=Prosopis cineraria TaxID=364024 RepID=UPI00240E9D07|nr:outer envelope pore protein 24, chloroplastic-like [Prosopis cineraria]
MKATLNWKHETNKKPRAEATFTVPAGEVKLQATVTEASILNKGPSLEGLVLALEKPDAFKVDYNVLKQDYNFKFMNTIRVLEKPLKFTYKHGSKDKSTDLDATLELDNDNKVSADCTFGSDKNKCKLNYTYSHKGLMTTLKPSYEVVHNSWDLAVSQKLYDNNTLEASYNTSNDNLGLSWSLASKRIGTFKASYETTGNILGLKWELDSKPRGCFEIGASLNLDEELKVPNVSAKATFDFDI